MKGGDTTVKSVTSALTIEDLTLNLKLNAESNGNYKYGGGALVTKSEYTPSRTYEYSTNIQVNLINSLLDIDSKTTKYSSGTFAGILLAGAYRQPDNSHFQAKNSKININSSLHGIYLKSVPLNFENTDLTINAGLGFNDGLNIREASKASGLYLTSKSHSTYIKVRPISFNFTGGSLNIQGINGIQMEPIDRTSGSYAPIKFSFSTENISNSRVAALDTHGYFDSTAAFIASTDDGIGSTIKLDGSLSLVNEQTFTSDVEQKQTAIYGLRTENFSEVSNQSGSDLTVTASGTGTHTDKVEVSAICALNSELSYAGTLSATAEGMANDDVKAIDLKASSFVSSGKVALNARKADSLGTAIYVDGTSKADFNSDNASSDESSIVGNVVVASGGKFALDRSDVLTFRGATLSEGESQESLGIDISLSNEKSKWEVTDDSTLDSLSLTGSTLSFDLGSTSRSSSEDSTFRKVETGNLTLNNATMKFKVNLADTESKADAVHAGNVSGNGIVDIRMVGPVTEHKSMSDCVGFLYQDSGDLTLHLADKNGDGKPDQVVYQNGGILGWKLAYKPTGEISDTGTETLAENTQEKPDFSDTDVNGTDSGYWYLTTGDFAEEEIPEPTPGGDDNPDLPHEVAQILGLGSSTAQAISFLSEKEDLRLRLGEIRYGAQDGVWVRAFNKQERVSDGFGFKQETTGIHLGFDHMFYADDVGKWLAGGALRYAKADQEGTLDANGGDGDLKEYSAKLYATYMANSGTYLDLVAQVGYYDQDLSGQANDYLTPVSASYNTFGTGISMEVGHMFKFGSDALNPWFIEPSAEMSFFHVNGESFTTSTGLNVSQEDANFLNGRLGVTVGKKFSYFSNDSTKERYFQLGLSGGINYEFLGDQDITFTDAGNNSMTAEAADISGLRCYYGVTADWQFADSARLYGNIRREEGSNYTLDYAVDIGLKYSF